MSCQVPRGAPLGSEKHEPRARRIRVVPTHSGLAANVRRLGFRACPRLLPPLSDASCSSSRLASALLLTAASEGGAPPKTLRDMPPSGAAPLDDEDDDDAWPLGGVEEDVAAAGGGGMTEDDEPPASLLSPPAAAALPLLPRPPSKRPPNNMPSEVFRCTPFEEAWGPSLPWPPVPALLPSFLFSRRNSESSCRLSLDSWARSKPNWLRSWWLSSRARRSSWTSALSPPTTSRPRLSEPPRARLGEAGPGWVSITDRS